MPIIQTTVPRGRLDSWVSFQLGTSCRERKRGFDSLIKPSAENSKQAINYCPILEGGRCGAAAMSAVVLELPGWRWFFSRVVRIPVIGLYIGEDANRVSVRCMLKRVRLSWYCSRNASVHYFFSVFLSFFQLGLVICNIYVLFRSRITLICMNYEWHNSTFFLSWVNALIS